MYCTGTFQESSKEMMNLSFPNPNNLHQHNQGFGNSSLLRFRSAPSSLIANLVNDSGSGSESDSVSMMSNDMYNSIGAIKSVLELEQNNGGYCDSSSLYGLQNHTDSFLSSVHIKAENGGSLNIMRQNSLQAGLFDNSVIESGLDAVKEAGSFNYCNDTNGSDHINFSSGPSSNSTIIPHTAKLENDSFGINSSEIRALQNGNSDLDPYMPAFTIDSWDEEPAFTGLKRTRDGNAKMFSGSQSWDEKGHSFGLTRHMSLPSSSIEMAAVAKYLHFQDSTPCKIRAKRGFATHPRSIAERVRRTRISDRMRKLQELFPDMDKQTNTADMLEMAVDYIKNLKKQVDVLTDTKSNCTCSSNQRLSHATA